MFIRSLFKELVDLRKLIRLELKVSNELEKKEFAKNLSASLFENDPNVSNEDWAVFDQDLYRFHDSEEFAWYGACFGQTKRILTTAIPTACVGYKEGELFFAANPRFLEQLIFKDRCFIYCHEIEHIVRSHLLLIGDHPEDMMEFNIIMDSLINESLIAYNNIWRRDDLPKWNDPDTGDPCNLITKDSLDDLIKQAKDGGGITNHSMPASLSYDKYCKDYDTESIRKYIPRNKNDEEDLFEKACKGLYGDFGEFFDDGSVPYEVKNAIIEQMIEEAEKSRGTAPRHLAEAIDKIRDKTNRNWRMMMRGFGRSSHIIVTRSWSKWNRRNPSLGMPLRPGKYFQARPKVLVMVDTSGSIGKDELISFIKEINGLTSKCIIDLAWVDTHFDEKDKTIFYKDIKDTRDFIKRAQKPVGRGGTVFEEFYTYAIKEYGNYQHLLMLTDGWADHIPKRLAPGQQLALMTPRHCEHFVSSASSHGFKIAVIEDLP